MGLSEHQGRRFGVLPALVGALALSSASLGVGFFFGRQNLSTAPTSLKCPDINLPNLPKCPSEAEVDRTFQKVRQELAVCKKNLILQEGYVAILNAYLQRPSSPETNDAGSPLDHKCREQMRDSVQARQDLDCHVFNGMRPFYREILGLPDASPRQLQQLTREKCLNVVFFANLANAQNQSCNSRPKPTNNGEIDGEDNKPASQPLVIRTPLVIACEDMVVVKDDAGVGLQIDGLLERLLQK